MAMDRPGRARCALGRKETMPDLTPRRSRVQAASAVVIGGHSYGGRVASLAAAGRGYRGLVCFSYPLHRPGGPDGSTRVAHWPAIACPALLLSGESDPFARIDLLRAAMAKLAHGELVTYPRLGHTLKPVLEDVLDRTAAFILGLPDP